MNSLKIGFWDTEWSPHTTYTWTQRPKYLPNEMLIEDARMLCFGWRWYDQKKVTVIDERTGYVEMLEDLRDRMSEVDLLVGYNSIAFDSKKTNALFMQHGITPPAPYKSLDLYKEIKKNATFYSGKLGFVADRIIGDTKVETGGFQLWKDVLAGDPKAWRKFRSYQAKDVNLLVDLFEKVRPWLKLPHPVEAGEGRCRNCGSHNLQRRGYAVSLQGRYQRYQCNECASWQRGTARITETDMHNIA